MRAIRIPILALATAAILYVGATVSTERAEAVCNSAAVYGDVASCSLAVNGEQDSFTFSGAIGERVLFRMREGTAAIAPKFTVRRPDGTQLCTGSGSSEVQGECTLTSPGLHTIVAESAPWATGDYTLYLARVSAPTTEAPTSIAYGDVLSGTIVAMKWHPFTFSGAIGEKLLVRVRELNAGLFPRMSLRRPDGSVLCSAFNSAEITAECTVNAPGTHTLWVYSNAGNESGGFNIHLARMSAPTTEAATPIAYGDVVTGSVTAMKWRPYTFTGAIGEKLLVRIREVAASVFPMMSLRRPDGSTLCSTGGNPEFTTECTLDTPGTYTIWVYSFGGTESGAFNLHLSRISAPTTQAATPISYGDVMTGSITGMKWHPYTFNGAVGEKLLIRAREVAASVFPMMSLRRPNGSTLCSTGGNPEFTTECTLDTPGTHTIWMYSINGYESGAFNIHLARMSTPTSEMGTNLPHDVVVSRGITPMRWYPYTFQGANGEEVLIHAEEVTSGLNPRMSLRRPNGSTVCTGASNIEFTTPCTLNTLGMHTIWIYSGNGHESGTLEFSYTSSSHTADTDWEADGGEYSFDEGCHPGVEIDPITTILISDEPTHTDAQQQTEDALTDAGLEHGVNAATTRQYFSDHGYCVEGSITQASKDSQGWGGIGLWWESRWHTRCNVVSLPSPVGYWSACTPHWDETDSDCPSAIPQVPGNHYVPDVFNDHVPNQGDWEGSGFDAGRDWLWTELIEDGMSFVGYLDYDNVQPMQQCNGQWTQADGKVNIIQLQ